MYSFDLIISLALIIVSILELLKGINQHDKKIVIISIFGLLAGLTLLFIFYFYK